VSSVSSPTPYHMLNMKRHAYWRRFVVGVFSMPHHMPNTKPHPCWCRFVFGKFSLPYHIYHTRNHTLISVISFLDPSLAPRMNFEGCLLDILYIIKLSLHIFNLIYRADGKCVGIPYPWMWDRNSAGMDAGQPKIPHGTPVSITTWWCHGGDHVPIPAVSWCVGGGRM
jgi:hypothetical protein